MTGKDIVKRARAFKSCRYWYGAKGEIATKALADRLKKENPGVWTAGYYEKALEDIDGATRVCDCSGLVCASYQIGTINSTFIYKKYSVYGGSPKPGMIAWKSGHVGIIIDDAGHMAEMRSQAYDYQETRTWKEAGMAKILYDPKIKYESIEDEQAVGWHKNDSGWWYRHKQGTGPDTYYHDTFANINGHRYVFDSDGYICQLERVPAASEEGWL